MIKAARVGSRGGSTSIASADLALGGSFFIMCTYTQPLSQRCCPVVRRREPERSARLLLWVGTPSARQLGKVAVCR